jgi:hypothetical protein
MPVSRKRRTKYDQKARYTPRPLAEVLLGISNGKVPFPEYAGRPVEFIEEKLFVKLTKNQKEMCMSVVTNKVTNVQASHGCGKSFLTALITVWWVFAEGGLVVTTAPTNRQVEEIIWSTIRSVHAKYSLFLGGTCGTKQMRLSEEARAYGFAPRNYDHNSFNGIHGKKLLLIQDEACGITKPVDDGFKSCATGSNNRILRIGNPIVPYTPFHSSCKLSHIRISAFTHPNTAWAYHVSDGCEYHRLKPEVAAAIVNSDGTIKPQNEWPPELPRDQIDGAVSIEWIEGIRKSEGEGSNYWLGRVEGVFPLSAIDNIFPMARVDALREESLAKRSIVEKLSARLPLTAAADVGDGGDDSSITILRGKVHIYSEKMPTINDGHEGRRLSDRLRVLNRKFGGFNTIAYDASGVGSWLQDSLELWYPGEIIRIKWGESSNDDRFTSIKAEQFDAVAKAITHREKGLWLLVDNEEVWSEICEQMGVTTKIMSQNDKMSIIPKQKLREEYGKSTDMLDSFVMAYAVVLGHAKGKNHQRDPGGLQKLFAMSGG